MQGSHTVLNIAGAKHTVVISWYTSMANPSFPPDSFSGFYGNRGYQFLWGGLTAYLFILRQDFKYFNNNVSNTTSECNCIYYLIHTNSILLSTLRSILKTNKAHHSIISKNDPCPDPKSKPRYQGIIRDQQYNCHSYHYLSYYSRIFVARPKEQTREKAYKRHQ